MSKTKEMSYIHADLRDLARPLTDVVADPANARRHDRANIDAIKGSLRQFGQRRPAVVQQQGMIVRAGNGMLQAARELGWSHLAMLVVDEDDVSAVTFGIADNRSAELASWDDDVLRTSIDAIPGGDWLVLRMLDHLLDEVAEATNDQDTGDVGDDAADNDPPATELCEQWSVLVNCADETEQRELYERMVEEGRKCKLLTV